MIISNYFESLTAELDALKNRVRNFIQDRHWLTEGQWKESVLRAFLRRNLPRSVQVGRGLVITESEISKQIDILIYDSTKPLLFQDGDLVIAPPDAVLGIIEVKTSLNSLRFKEAVEVLSAQGELIRSRSTFCRVFGLFSYEDRTRGINDTLAIIKKAVNGQGSRIIDLICLGQSKFIKYWNIDPVEGKTKIDRWHAYELEKKAPGYFIHNIVEAICPYSVSLHEELWYPREGKERNKIGEISWRDE
jgi:hypothetical protein